MKAYAGRAGATLLRSGSLVLAVIAALLMGGCSEPLGPDDQGCYGWYQGFYVLSTPESLYIRVELDLSWGLPDSAWIFTPLFVFEPDRVFERSDPPGLAVGAAVDDVISGWFSFRARYDASVRVYEEHVIVRNDVLNYDFGSVEPQRGATGVSLTPLVSWTELRDTQARVRVYADSLRQEGLFDSGGIDDAGSMRIPAGVLAPGTLYYWTLEVYDWQEFLPDCSLGYYYMDFFDNGLIYVGWFTTAEAAFAWKDANREIGAGHREGGEKADRRAAFPPISRRK
jgi:hypothetical protein